jgi:hypothetical protein
MSYTKLKNNKRIFNNKNTNHKFKDILPTVLEEINFSLKDKSMEGFFDIHTYQKSNMTIQIRFNPDDPDTQYLFSEPQNEFCFEVKPNNDSYDLFLSVIENEYIMRTVDKELDCSLECAFNNLFEYLRAGYSDSSFCITK